MEFMKSARYSSHGGPEVLEIQDIEKPNPTENQVLVENYAASINPFDFKVRSGMIPGMPSEFPITIGGDFAGKVIEVGAEVENIKIGDEVYGQASVFGGASGSFAEYLVANPGSISKKPTNLDFYEAASLPLTGISAIQALEDYIKLEKGQRILINGGSGGIGSISIQIAKSIGAFVATTVSTENVEFAKSLGADLVIDYKKESVDDLKDFDAIFDTSGKEAGEQLFGILKSGSTFVSMTGQVNKEASEKYGINVISQNSQTTTERLNKLRDYVEREVVNPQIEKMFELSEVVDAFKYQETQKIRGQVVIKIR